MLLTDIKENINLLLGLDNSGLEPHQMCARAIVVFFIALTYVRIGGIRMLGKQSAYDTLTTLILGAMMGKAIISTESFIGTLLAALVLMALHWVVAWVTFKSSFWGGILKGKSLLLFCDGKPVEKNLKKVQITERDLLEAVRKKTHSLDLNNVKEIYMERSGELSVVTKE